VVAERAVIPINPLEQKEEISFKYKSYAAKNHLQHISPKAGTLILQ
jgi:hypothetical protein